MMLFDRAGPGPVVAYTPAPTAPRSLTTALTYVLTGREGYSPEPRKRRIAGLIATFIVHVGLLWMLVTSFHDRPGLGPATMPGNGLSVFDIAGISKTEAEASVPTPSKATDEASTDKVTNKNQSSGTAAASTTASEVPALQSSEGAGGAPPVLTVGGGAPLGGNYDPYAGASVVRAYQTSPDAISANLQRLHLSPADILDVATIDQTAFAVARQTLLAIDPAAKGEFNIVVRCDEQGRVTAARSLGGTANAQDGAWLASALLGRRILVSGATFLPGVWKILPPIRID